MRAPGPAMTWVLLDEDPVNLNDAAFAFGMESPDWFDVPGTYHNHGCGFAFGDGHSEYHKWKMSSEKQGNGYDITNPSDQQDWMWMRDRTSADSSGTMPPPKL